MFRNVRSKVVTFMVLAMMFVMVLGMGAFASDYPNIDDIVQYQAAQGNNYFVLYKYLPDNNYYITFNNNNTEFGVQTNSNTIYGYWKCYYKIESNNWVLVNTSASFSGILSDFNLLVANYNVINYFNNTTYLANNYVPSVTLTSISISGTNSVYTSGSGNTSQLTAIGTYSDNTTKNITTDCDWTSGTPSIATVGLHTGIVTGVSAGTATITATKDGISDTYDITVNNPVTVTSITVSPASANVLTSGNTSLVANANYSDNTSSVITTDTNCSWTSNNESAATVGLHTGIVTGISEGTATITATYTVNGTPYTDTCTITVSPFSGNHAIIEITMTNGKIKEYDMTIAQIDAFLTWYDNRANGTGKSYYTIRKTSNVKPFLGRRDYIIFDKILDFEVKDYND